MAHVWKMKRPFWGKKAYVQGLLLVSGSVGNIQLLNLTYQFRNKKASSDFALEMGFGAIEPGLDVDFLSLHLGKNVWKTHQLQPTCLRSKKKSGFHLFQGLWGSPLSWGGGGANPWVLFYGIHHEIIKFDTVEGRNLAPPDMYETMSIIGYVPYQLVQDLLNQQRESFCFTLSNHQRFANPGSWT